MLLLLFLQSLMVDESSDQSALMSERHICKSECKLDESAYHTLLTQALLLSCCVQWKEGDDEPDSWKDHYQLNPCVPVDYKTVTAAMDTVMRMIETVNAHSNTTNNKPIRSVTILLQPGRHYLQDPINIEMHRRSFQVTFESITNPSSERTICLMDGLTIKQSKRATLVFRSRQRNQPLFRVVQGALKIKNLSLEHQSFGIDIWNGNAAIQIQPSLCETSSSSSRTSSKPQATVHMSQVEVTSHSGRGVVAADGCRLVVNDCFIHHCAATGVYVAGRDTRVSMDLTDVIHNGTGNQRTGGIGRGHSGIYVEHGKVSLQDCNISCNTAAGVSIVTSEQSELEVDKCDVLENGYEPIELPMSEVGRHQIAASNNVGLVGNPRRRSTLAAHDNTYNAGMYMRSLY
jgi:hypothetical protein